MGHRFTDTEKWEEDWYCELGGEYQKFWDYICDKCDNAGTWKPNKISFEVKTKFKVNLDSFLQKVNGDKERIALLDNGRWFILGFIKYQWFTKHNSFSLNLGNRFHKAIYNILIENNVPLEKVRGFDGGLKPPKDKDKDNIGNEGMGNSASAQGFEPPYKYLDVVMPRPPHAPTLEKVKEFFWQQGKQFEDGKLAERFFNHHEGIGWRKGLSPIYSWQSFATNWVKNPTEFDTKQEPKNDSLDRARKIFEAKK